MIHSKRFYMRIRNTNIGPGGWKCACCAPPPGKQRVKVVRMRKKLERRFFSDLIREELSE